MTYVIPRRPLGATGLLVSVIGLGALEIGRDWAGDVDPDPRHLDENNAIRFVHEVLDLGINFIDTAPAYWHSEEYLGKALKGKRDQVILATKVGEHCDRQGSYYDYSYDATLQFIDRSLARLQTDWIDLIQIHSAPIEVLERGETLQALLKAKQDGKVRHIGMTGSVEQCRRALEIGGYETVQVPYNLLNLRAETEVFPLAREHQAGVIIMRGLAGGKLTPKYHNLADESLKAKIASFEKLLTHSGAPDLSHLAIAYVVAAPEVSSVIVGTRKAIHLKKTITAAEHELSPDLVAEIRAHAAALGITVW